MRTVPDRFQDKIECPRPDIERAIDVHRRSGGTNGGLADEMLALTGLGLMPGVLARYRAAFRCPSGMLLVGGPAGSGKTTTLYASVSEVDCGVRRVMSVEDPIEYELPGIDQTAVNIRAGMTCAGGLRALLRRNPDVILVGELRDVETVTTAILSALTGRLVFTSIRASDAADVLIRLLDMDVEPASMNSSLIGVLAQRLVRRICPGCRAPYEPTEMEVRAYETETGTKVPVLYHGTGCSLCAGTGYRGRTGIFEFLAMTGAMRELLRRRTGAGVIRAQAVAEGMITMRRDGMMKARDGVTSIGEVIRSVFSID